MPKKIKPITSKVPKAPKLSSDALFKRIMSEKIAAREFLEEYLPADFKHLVDLNTINVEQESYVESHLRKKYSDVVYSIKTNHNDERAYIFTLVEHQSTVDPLIALRLWRYMLLLCERHSKNHNKLPLVMPIVVYHGQEKYTAARDLWQLFVDPSRARELMTNEYKLIDLQATSDDEIKRKNHLGMLEYIFKHIHQRDMFKLWQDFTQNFQQTILIDKQNGYVYIEAFLWYIDQKVPATDKKLLNNLVINSLPDGEQVMRSVAQSYIEEGIEKGIEKTALRMLAQNMPIPQVANFTGLPIATVMKLKESL